LGKRERAYRQLTDEALLEKYVSGRRLVMKLLYERYATLTFGLCLKYLKNRSNAEDALSEIFLELDNKLPQDREVENFRAWFYVLSRNYCLSLLRKENSRQRRRGMMEQEMTIQTISGANPEYELAKVDKAISGLKEIQRLCILGFYYEKMSYQELSVKLKLSVKQVKSNLQNGKRNLKIMLTNHRNND
jgi:RNA polymerase sigma-70 factor (ECF subfamily)